MGEALERGDAVQRSVEEDIVAEGDTVDLRADERERRYRLAEREDRVLVFEQHNGLLFHSVQELACLRRAER